MVMRTGELPHTGVKWYNYIDSIGCNVIGLAQVHLTSVTHQRPLEDFWKAISDDIDRLLEVDDDYAQLVLVQLTRGTGCCHDKPIRDNFDVLFTTEVKGGHGNAPLVLYGLDVSKRREHLNCSASDYDDDDGGDPEYGYEGE